MKYFPELRFKDDNGNDFPEWKAGKLSELIDKNRKATSILLEISLNHLTEHDGSNPQPSLLTVVTFLSRGPNHIHQLPDMFPTGLAEGPR